MNRDLIADVLVPIHREGWRFIAAFALASVLLFAIAAPLGWLGLALTAWCAYFFRDPHRTTPVEPGLLVSPADGVVQAIAPAVPPTELEMGPVPRPRISVFMNVFDVHVNRAPADGRVTKVAYRPGRFFNASLDKASEHNERMAVRMATDDGKDIAFVQIAGLIARRILCWVAEGDRLLAGERFGMIRFGSRVDVYLDEGMIPLVCVGQRAIAGETPIARALGPGENAAPRRGEVR